MAEDVEAGPIDAPEPIAEEAPSAIALGDDTLIETDDGPVSWKDYSSQNYVPKSDFTKAQQKARSDYEARLQAETARINQQAQQYQQQLANYYAQQRQGQGQQAPAHKGVLEKAESQGYVTADHLGQLYEMLRQQELQPLAQRNDQLVQALHLINQQLVQNQSQVAPYLEQAQQQRIENAIRDTGKKLGVSDDAMPWFLETGLDLWAAHEGDDLQEAFPQMLEDRYRASEKALKAIAKAQAAAVKRGGISPNGGRANPSNPIKKDELDTDKIVEQFWTDEQDTE